MTSVRAVFDPSCHVGSAEMTKSIAAFHRLFVGHVDSVAIISHYAEKNEYALEMCFDQEPSMDALVAVGILPRIADMEILRCGVFFNTQPIARCTPDGTTRALTRGDPASPPPDRAMEELVMSLLPPPPRDNVTWFKVGCALRQTSPSFLALFESYSRRSDVINDPARKCPKMWNCTPGRTQGPQATWRTLKDMARNNAGQRHFYLNWCRKYGFLE
jgi:hypothetical protein